MPMSFSEFEWLIKQGIRSIVTIREKPLPSNWITYANNSNSNSINNNNNNNKQEMILIIFI